MVFLKVSLCDILIWFDLIYQQQYIYISYNNLHIQKETIGW